MLVYGRSNITIMFDDRQLAHIQIVVGYRLSHRNCFFLSWKESAQAGSGRSSIWLDPSIPLCFHYASPGQIDINADWLRILALSADSRDGMICVPEPGTDPHAMDLPHSHI